MVGVSDRENAAGERDTSLILRRRATLVDAVVCVALVLVAVDVSLMNWRLYHQDVDVFMAISRRMLAGQVIYRDFWMAYPPGLFFLYAGLMKLFGASHQVIKLSAVVLFAPMPPAIYLVVRRYASVGAALFAAVLSIAACPPSHKVIVPLLSVIALWTVASLSSGPTRSRTLRAGVAVGLAVLFKHEFGFLLSLVLLACLWFAPVEAALAVRSRPTRIGWYLVGIALPLLPVIGYFWYRGALRALAYDVIVDPFYSVSGMSTSMKPPFAGGLSAMLSAWQQEVVSHVVYLAPLAYGGIMLRTARSVLGGRSNDRSFFVFFGSLVGWAMLINWVSRTDFPHVRQGILPLFVLAAIGLDGLLRGLRGRLPGSPFRLAGAAIIVAYGVWFAAAGLSGKALLPSSARLRQINSVPQRLAQVVAYVSTHVGSTETVFAVPRVMDVYNLTGRLNPFTYGDLFPGVFGRHPREAEAALVAQVRRKADVVVLDTTPWAAGPERNELSEYAPQVSAFITQECRPVATVANRFVILRRIHPRR
jgi:hypothetical protein